MKPRHERWWDPTLPDLDVVWLTALVCDPSVLPEERLYGERQALCICAERGLLDTIATVANEVIEYDGVMHLGNGMTIMSGS